MELDVSGSLRPLETYLSQDSRECVSTRQADFVCEQQQQAYATFVLGLGGLCAQLESLL